MVRETGTVIKFISMGDWGQIKRDSNGQLIDFYGIEDVEFVEIIAGMPVSFEIGPRGAKNVHLEGGEAWDKYRISVQCPDE